MCIRDSLLTLIILDILTHRLQLLQEVVQSLFEGTLSRLILQLKQLYKLDIDPLSFILGLGHSWEVKFLVGVVKLDQLLLHLILVYFPGVVYIHPLNLTWLLNSL